MLRSAVCRLPDPETGRSLKSLFVEAFSRKTAYSFAHAALSMTSGDFARRAAIKPTMSKSPLAMSRQRANPKAAAEGGDKVWDRFGDKSHIKGLKNGNTAVKTVYWNSASETIFRASSTRSLRQKRGSGTP
jgi:hypothetical protein